MIGLAAGCGNTVNEWHAIPNHHARSLPRLPSMHSWASLGKPLLVDALSQFINNCLTFVDTNDQLIQIFFIADKINC